MATRKVPILGKKQPPALEEVHCTRCKKDDHNTKDCDKPWPPWKKQECDICFSEEHEALYCKYKKDFKSQSYICTRCGHGFHEEKSCPFGTDKVEDMAQFTQLRFSNLRESDRAQVDKYLQSDPAQTSSAYGSSTGHLAGGTFAGNSGGNLQAGTSSPPDPTQQPSGIPISPTSIPQISKSDKKAMEEAYEQAALNLEEPPILINNTTNTPTFCANYFKISVKNETVNDIRRYRIVLDQINGKTITRRETKEALIKNILTKQHPPTAEHWVSDYVSQIVSVGKLYTACSAEDEPTAYMLNHYRTGRPNAAGPTYEEMNSVLVYEGRLDMARLLDHVDVSKSRDITYNPEVDLRMLNMISWRMIYPAADDDDDRIRRVGKTFYRWNTSPRSFGSLREKDDRTNPEVYEGRTGFFTSVRPGIDSLLLNISLTTTAFFPPDSMLDQWMRKRWMNNGSPPVLRNSRELEDVRVVFLGDKPLKPRIIRNFHANDVSTVTFVKKLDDKTSQVISVFDHMNEAYRELKPFNQQAYCVNLGGKTSETQRWYPADKLRIVNFQPVKGKVDDLYTASMLRIAKKNPAQTKTEIMTHATIPLGFKRPKNASSTWKPFYQSWGLSIEEDLIQVKPRYLALPQLRFAGYNMNTKVLAETSLNPKMKRNIASWDLREISKNNARRFYTLPKRKPRIFIIRIEDPQNEDSIAEEDAETFWSEFEERLKTYGIECESQKCGHGVALCSELLDRVDWRNQFVDNLNGTYNELGKTFNTPASAIIVLLPNKNADIYADVKWWGDCQVGVPTICVTADAMNRAHNYYRSNGTNAGPDYNLSGNLSMKLNFKLQGIVHILKDPLGVERDTMVVGADVSHPGKCKDETCPSMAGVVATACDDDFSHYFASARLQENNTEYIADLEGMMRERLRAYFKKCGKLPRNILFYRDGVSESQYGMVKVKELPQIRAACQTIATEKNAGIPRVTLLVVGKRHHTRFFPRRDETKNPLAGMVVDSTIVAPNQFNFYLQSHDSPIGTARTGHYVVIVNESKYTANALQEITNKLCFLGSRATKGLSICIPARYADILCDRLRCYMKPALESYWPDGNAAVGVYERSTPSIWIGPQAPTKSNPWHNDLDECMFYL